MFVFLSCVVLVVVFFFQVIHLPFPLSKSQEVGFSVTPAWNCSELGRNPHDSHEGFNLWNSKTEFSQVGHRPRILNI